MKRERRTCGDEKREKKEEDGEEKKRKSRKRCSWPTIETKWSDSSPEDKKWMMIRKNG